VFPSDRTDGPIVETRKAWERLFDRDELGEIMERLHQRGIELPSAGETLARTLHRARALAAAHGVDPTDARLTDLRPHDLRRTLGSWQAALGSSLAVIGKSLNHRSLQATLIYARLEQNPVRESVERAATAMLSAGEMLPAHTPNVLERAKNAG
jgi:integrase